MTLRRAMAVMLAVVLVTIVWMLASPFSSTTEDAQLPADDDSVDVEMSDIDRSYVAAWEAWQSAVQERNRRLGRLGEVPGIESDAAFQSRVASLFHVGMTSLDDAAQALLDEFDDPFRQGQILHTKAVRLLNAGDADAPAAVDEAVRHALWPEQECLMHLLLGNMVAAERARTFPQVSAEDAPEAYRALTRRAAEHYLRGLKAAYDLPDLPELPPLDDATPIERAARQMQSPSGAMHETSAAPSARVQAIEQRFSTFETLRRALEVRLTALYTPANAASELAPLAAEWLDDPARTGALVDLVR